MRLPQNGMYHNIKRDLRDTSCNVGWSLVNINVDQEFDDFYFPQLYARKKRKPLSTLRELKDLGFKSRIIYFIE